MKIIDITLQKREVDDDFAIFGKGKDGDCKCFVLSKELLQHLRNSIDKRVND